MKKLNIAMDGTSGVGKSSVADLLAEKYGMIHLDTGAMYRAIALGLQDSHIPLEEGEQLEQTLANLDVSFDADHHVLLNGQDVSGKIRTEEISALTSKIATLESVRDKMVKAQQKIAAGGGYIVDGRDICSVVLPDARVKVYLSATPEARARRRTLQYQQQGLDADYEAILAQIQQRDWQDSHRSISPLKKAEDAVEIDTSDKNIDEVVAAISALIDAAC